MAQMIPVVPHPSTPYSEKRIFELLRLEEGCRNWVVLHSLGLTHTGTRPYGEVDFVVLVPGKGIICLEIKGGEISCHDGIWKTGNRKTGEVHILGRGPYLQARDSMFSLRGAILKHFGDTDPASKCVFSYSVIFPDVHSPPVSAEAESWETVDMIGLRRPLADLIKENLEATSRKLSRKISRESVSRETLNRIREFLRPDFERIIARSTSIARTEECLVTLTREQYDFLDVAEANSRAIVTGPAGTGKTLLALELARRESSRGRRVLLICYNRLLGIWLRSVVRQERLKDVTAGTYHSTLHNVISTSSYQDEFIEDLKTADDQEAYQHLYPFYGELTLAETGHTVDTLIIDESQDLVASSNLSVFNAWLKGGLAGGRWTFFGDFCRQAIYSESIQKCSEDTVLSLLSEHGTFSKVPLRVNCRNSRPIAEETALLSGFDILPYRLGEAEGLAVDYRFFKNAEQETEQLVAALTKLMEEDVASDDVVLLSLHRLEDDFLADVGRSAGVDLVPPEEIRHRRKKCFAVTTVHAFKGMESPVVVLCGLRSIQTEKQKSLAYVGMSRARSHLILIAGESIRTILPELVKQNLTRQWVR